MHRDRARPRRARGRAAPAPCAARAPTPRGRSSPLASRSASLLRLPSTSAWLKPMRLVSGVFSSCETLARKSRCDLARALHRLRHPVEGRRRACPISSWPANADAARVVAGGDVLRRAGQLGERPGERAADEQDEEHRHHERRAAGDEQPRARARRPRPWRPSDCGCATTTNAAPSGSRAGAIADRRRQVGLATERRLRLRRHWPRACDAVTAITCRTCRVLPLSYTTRRCRSSSSRRSPLKVGATSESSRSAKSSRVGRAGTPAGPAFVAAPVG